MAQVESDQNLQRVCRGWCRGCQSPRVCASHPERARTDRHQRAQAHGVVATAWCLRAVPSRVAGAEVRGCPQAGAAAGARRRHLPAAAASGERRPRRAPPGAACAGRVAGVAGGSGSTCGRGGAHRPEPARPPETAAGPLGGREASPDPRSRGPRGGTVRSGLCAAGGKGRSVRSDPVRLLPGVKKCISVKKRAALDCQGRAEEQRGGGCRRAGTH